VVNPKVDTTYYVKAEKTPGCFAYDTIRVKVFQSPPINLGPDRSFCSGDSATLDAGAGFDSYLWNGVVGNQHKTVYTIGTYRVHGITKEGCQSSDTAVVVNVWALPRSLLNKDSTLCTGSIRNLSAGNFISYLWQDGSNGPTYTVNGIGTYTVQVTDDHGCMGSDTVRLTTILPLPSGFLPADTAVCSYGTLNLSPLQSYPSYLWSTSERSSSIRITKAGVYWLDVQNQSGCTGRDTIIVNPKECITGLHVPTAFTPNRDGKNDSFRAMVFGNTKRFELAVYNRWGQVVFFTTDPSRGWDGKVAGINQETGVFVWTCRYQIEGGKESFEKGTVSLIR
jgi:gliding motility-associated-like protein